MQIQNCSFLCNLVFFFMGVSAVGLNAKYYFSIINALSFFCPDKRLLF